MGSRILVVDDEKFIVEAVSQHLTHCGYDVAPFTNASEALKAIEDEDFDLVLTDLRMPDISGMDITKAVYEKKTDTMVIILTGYATLDSAIESVHLQVYAYLNKPFDLRQLGQVVERALTEQRLKRENEVLQARIAQMLGDVTTLHKVTRLLYNTKDWDITMEFILDTLSISLGLTHSCLVFETKTGEFEIGKHNFPDGSVLGEKILAFEWKDLTDQLPSEELIKIGHDNNQAQMLDYFSVEDEKFTEIYLIPLSYHEKFLGYLVIFHLAGSEDLTEDQETLLKILATQIAPQAYNANSNTYDLQGNTAIDITTAKALMAKHIDSSEGERQITIGLFRFLAEGSLASAADVEQFHQVCEKSLRNGDAHAEVVWLTPDTSFVAFPGSNKAQAEITCMTLAQDMGLSMQSVMSETSMFYSLADWPQESQDTEQLIYLVWSRLLDQIRKELSPSITENPVDG
ncbi:MAG: response regulator [Candidatus Marinimicrobia bacterium]|nr:response regulator [Candidatus Neomarinimicrobiota bacterium]